MTGINWIEILINISLASLGGIVHRLADAEKSNHKKVKPSIYISSAIISMFVGIIAYAFCKNYSMAPYLTIMLTATAGFVGTPVIYLIYNVVQGKVSGPKGGESQ